MNRVLLLRSSLMIALLFSLTAVGCSAASNTNTATPVKAEQGRTAFFDRPVALAAARKSSVPSPEIVLLETNPWLDVIGSDSPAFALYSDGSVIYRVKDGFKSAKLDKSQQASLESAFENNDLAGMAGAYQATQITDQPENNLLIYGKKSPFYISVYGSLDGAEVRSKLPAEVLSAYDKLRTFDRPDAQDWLPDKIEVMIWPYEYAPDASIVWPQKWPDLNAETTRKRGDSYSIFVPSAELSALRTFLASRREKGAVEIDGKKWAASIRLPFPQENLWMAPKTE